jgi:hypothetical protein
MKKSIIILALSFFCFLNSYSQTSAALQDNEQLNEKVNIAGIVKGDIAKEVMLNSKGLSIDDKKNSVYRIVSFRMTIVIKGTAPKEFYNEKNGELTEEMRDAIKRTSTGSKIYFEYIKCIDENNLTHKFNPAAFILK